MRKSMFCIWSALAGILLASYCSVRRLMQGLCRLGGMWMVMVIGVWSMYSAELVKLSKSSIV